MKEYKGQRIENLYAFLKGTKEDEIIVRTTRVAGGWHDNEFDAKGEAVYFNRAWKHGKETWVVQGIGETLVIGRDRQKRRSRTFTQLPQAEKYLARMGFKAAP